MNQGILNEILDKIRKPIKKRRNFAHQKILSSLGKAEPDRDLMVNVMEYAIWIRADLELLLRLAFWKDLNNEEIGKRILLDQEDLIKAFIQRTKSNDTILEELAKKIDQKKIAEEWSLKSIERTENLLEKIEWEKVGLTSLYDHFYKILTKVCHPDPYMVFFPTHEKEWFDQIRNSYFPILKTSANQIDAFYSKFRDENLIDFSPSS